MPGLSLFPLTSRYPLVVKHWLIDGTTGGLNCPIQRFLTL
jgi:hypothetical protein